MSSRVTNLIAILLICFLAVLYVHANKKPNTAAIQIVGDATCQSETQAALEYLKTKAFTYYEFAEEYIATIECVPQGSGIRPNEKSPTFYAGDETRGAGTEWFAGTIVHDACHVWEYREYAKKHAGIVPADVYSGEQAEIKCIDIQVQALKQAGASQATLNWLEESKKSKYWEQQGRWW